MIVAFGTSTPTSITVVATSTSSSPRLERAHQLAPVGRLQPAVQAARRGSRASSPRRSRSASCSAARGDATSRTPRSAGRRRTPAAPRRGARAGACTPRRPAPRRPSAVTIGRRFAGGLAISVTREVAVDRERERARDRRRGHVQHVRRAALGERRPLLDAEAVLLVDDGDREVGELDLAPGSARACRPRAAPRRSRCASRAAACSFARSALVSSTTRTPSSAQSPSIVRKCCSASVSVGAISAPWRPCLDRAQERVERDDGLARADVALEQPLHRHRAREVGVDLARSPCSWCGRQLERQRLAVARDQLARLAERRRDRVPRARGRGARSRAGARAARRRRAVGARLGLVERRAAGGARRARRRRSGSLVALGSAAGSGSANASRRRARPRRARAAATAATSSLRRVDRREVGGRARVADVVRLHGEAATSRERARAAAPRVPGVSRSATHGWLNQTASISPLSSRTRDVQDRQAPRRPPARSAAPPSRRSRPPPRRTGRAIARSGAASS